MNENEILLEILGELKRLNENDKEIRLLLDELLMLKAKRAKHAESQRKYQARQNDNQNDTKERGKENEEGKEEIPPYNPPIGEREEGKESPKENSLHRARARFFVKPTVEEVKKYCAEKGYDLVDAERFIAFYESKNWFVGKNKMTNWRSACYTWQARHKQEKQEKEDRYANCGRPNTSNARCQAIEIDVPI